MRPSTQNSGLREAEAGLSRRIVEIRLELYGEHGGPTLAEALGLPSRTWQNYEAGVTIPGLIVLQFLALTGVCPYWLRTGKGPRYRRDTTPSQN